MNRSNSRIWNVVVLTFAAVVSSWSSNSFGVNFTLNSFENGTEGWQDSFGANTDPGSVTVVSGIGNTDGSNALAFTVNANGFEWAIERFLFDGADAEYTDFVTALSNPVFS